MYSSHIAGDGSVCPHCGVGERRCGGTKETIKDAAQWSVEDGQRKMTS